MSGYLRRRTNVKVARIRSETMLLVAAYLDFDLRVVLYRYRRQILELIKGVEGTEVKISIASNGNNSLVELTRKKVEQVGLVTQGK